MSVGFLVVAIEIQYNITSIAWQDTLSGYCYYWKLIILNQLLGKLNGQKIFCRCTAKKCVEVIIFVVSSTLWLSVADDLP